MLPIVFILVAALITVIAINNGLRSDLKYYMKLSNDNWQKYQAARAELSEAESDLAAAQIEHATERKQLIQDKVNGEECERAAALKWRRQVTSKLQTQIELMRVMLDAMAEVIPEKYICPKCMCKWRENTDGTMSLFDETCKSCQFCEHAPLSELDPVRADGSVISDGSI
jgi:hypothetical protein